MKDRRTYTRVEAARAQDVARTVVESIPENTMDPLLRIARSAALVRSYTVAEFNVSPRELSPGEKTMIAPGRKSRWQHVVWCCDQIPHLAGTDIFKAMRWLGFVHGCGWSMNLVSIEQLAALWPEDRGHPFDDITGLILEGSREAYIEQQHARALRGLAAVVKEFDATYGGRFLSLAKQLPDIEQKAHTVSRELKIGHVAWCCEQVPKIEKTAKMHLWLGFVQGCSWMMGFSSIDMLRKGIAGE